MRAETIGFKPLASFSQRKLNKAEDQRIVVRWSAVGQLIASAITTP